MRPITPLDGGYVTEVVNKWFRYGGGTILAVWTVLDPVYSFALIWMLIIRHIRLEPVIRLGLGMILFTTMCVMIGSGHGDEFKWVNAFFVVMGLFMVIDYAQLCRVNDEQVIDLREEIVPRGEQKKWLIRFVLLTSYLGALLCATWQLLSHV